MSDKFGGNWMVGVAANYRTVVTQLTPPNVGFQQLLKPDPRRWYLRIGPTSAPSATAQIRPGPPPAAGSTFSAVPVPLELKFRDAPNMVTGEWWCNNPGATSFVIWEELYIGE